MKHRNVTPGSATYYAVKVGHDRYDLRQSRYRADFNNGMEHANDLMMCSFSAEGMRNWVASRGWDADLTALEA